MSAEFSTYGANAVLDGTALPATLYVKGHLGNPGPAGLLNAAVHATRQSFTRVASVAGATTNVAVVTWLLAVANETWTHWSAWDASVAGNCWMVGSLVSSTVISIGDTIQIGAGDLDLSITVWS